MAFFLLPGLEQACTLLDSCSCVIIMIDSRYMTRTVRASLWFCLVLYLCPASLHETDFSKMVWFTTRAHLNLAGQGPCLWGQTLPQLRHLFGFDCDFLGAFRPWSCWIRLTFFQGKVIFRCQRLVPHLLLELWLQLEVHPIWGLLHEGHTYADISTDNFGWWLISTLGLGPKIHNELLVFSIE